MLEEAQREALTKLKQAVESGLEDESVVIYQTTPVKMIHLSGEIESLPRPRDIA